MNERRLEESLIGTSIGARLGHTLLHGLDEMQTRDTLCRAFKELYRGLDLLRNYRLLNYAAFVKILKKCVCMCR